MTDSAAGDGPSALAALLLIALYLAIGRLLYARRWPNGLFPRHVDPERERWRRQKRTRVLPHVIEDRPSDE